MDAPTIKGAYRTMIPWSRGGFLAVGEDSVVRMLRRNSDDIDEVKNFMQKSMSRGVSAVSFVQSIHD